MKQHIKSMSAMVITTTLLSGCMSGPGFMNMKTDTPVSTDVVRLEAGGSGRADHLIDAGFEARSKGENKQAAALFEQALQDYRSVDGSFETATNTVLALTYLELGYIDDFKRVSNQLESSIDRFHSLTKETQFVLQLGRAFRKQKLAAALPGRSHDPKMTRYLEFALNGKGDGDEQ